MQSNHGSWRSFYLFWLLCEGVHLVWLGNLATGGSLSTDRHLLTTKSFVMMKTLYQRHSLTPLLINTAQVFSCVTVTVMKFKFLSSTHVWNFYFQWTLSFLLYLPSACYACCYVVCKNWTECWTIVQSGKWPDQLELSCTKYNNNSLII